MGVDWEALQIRPSYKCAPDKQNPERYPDPPDPDFESGLCGRIIQPQGVDLVLVHHGLKRFRRDGWEVPDDLGKIMYIDVAEDYCIAKEETCREDYDSIGFVGSISAFIAIALVVLSFGMDIHHDYLMRQLQFLDEKELRGTRMIRRQMESDKLRQMELAQYEQTMRLEELHNTLHQQAKMTPGGQEAPDQDGMFKPLPGSVQPVK